MKFKNAIKKLERNGFDVSITNDRSVVARKGNRDDYISFFRNWDGEEIHCIAVGSDNDQRDVYTDYFPETYCDTLTQAIKIY